MITLEHDALVFRFPEVHEDAVLRIQFQRTLRLPDDGKDHPLPPGLGAFPLRHLDDHADRLPESWRKRGGVILPMYQAEALWILFRSFGSFESYPFAVKVAAGKINAVSGEPWSVPLHRHPQDYVAVPQQPWLDGFSVGQGIVRQFVAMPLGEGWSAEEQLTGTAEWGGIQLLVCPLRADRWREIKRAERRRDGVCLPLEAPFRHLEESLAPGGRMRQEIYEDERPLEDWDQRHVARCFVTILNALQWHAVTGEAPPHRPPTARAYTKAGLPWFEWYDADAKALRGSERLAGVKSIADMAKDKGLPPDPEDEAEVRPHRILRLGPSRRRVREAEL